MSEQPVTLYLPETIYTRLTNTAQAMQQSLEEVLLRALQVGSPPSWDDVPAEFQPDLAAMDRLDDNALWEIARAKKSEAEFERYQTLLDKQTEDGLSAEETAELTQLRFDADRFMLRKAHAAAILRWRGHVIPPASKL